MRSEQLTEQQFDAVRRQVQPTFTLPGPAQSRGGKSAASRPTNRLYVLAAETRQALQALCMELHDLSCGNVGRPPSAAP